MPQDLGPIFVVATESAKGKPLVYSYPRKLHPGAFLDVAGTQPDGDFGAGSRRVQGRRDADVQAILGGIDLGHLLLEDLDVADENLIDQSINRLQPDRFQPGSDDRSVGHSIEGEGAGVPVGMEVLEGALDRAASGASGGNQGSIDVEEKYGGSHGRSAGKGKNHGSIMVSAC